MYTIHYYRPLYGLINDNYKMNEFEYELKKELITDSVDTAINLINFSFPNRHIKAGDIIHVINNDFVLMFYSCNYIHTIMGKKVKIPTLSFDRTSIKYLNYKQIKPNQKDGSILLANQRQEENTY
jgi:hypothetical protein